MVLVGYWADEGQAGAVKALESTAEASTSLREAAELCINAARGQAPSEGEKAPDRDAGDDGASKSRGCYGRGESELAI